MRVASILIISLYLISCQPDEKKVKEINEIVSDCHDVVVEDLFPPDTAYKDTVFIPKTIIAYQIDDYYSYFFRSSVNEIKNNTEEDAFKRGAFLLNEIDYQNGFISLRTQNTPLDMDGDSETEYGYEITYWIQSDSSRIIAVCKTEYTWVSEESELTFFIHDKSGINQFNPAYGGWTINSFTDKDVKEHFSEELFTNPPIYVQLPKEGKDIRIDLAFYEYYEPVEVFETYESLKVVRNSLLLNPLEGELKEIKAW